MLRDHYPGVDFDVINAAITAINSHVVLPIARDCSRMESDLFVIYLGNNEVVGPYGAGTIFSPLVSSLSVIRAGIALKATRLGQLISDTTKKLGGRRRTHPGRWGGMEMFLSHQVRATDPGMAVVYRHFEENLSDICRIAQKSGIPAIVSTVGVNLRDSAPFASLHRPGLSPEDTQAWEDIVGEGEKLQELGRFEQAAERFLQAEKIDADHAELHFRLGRCYWAMWDFEQAKARFVKARELDALRFRADTEINEIIRRVAGEKPDHGIYLADSLQVLEANSPESTPGYELFYEHVHMNFRATYLVARTIFEQVRRALPERVSRHTSGREVLSERECARRLAYTGWSRLTIAKEIRGLMQLPPFSGQLYSSKRVEELTEEIEVLQARYASMGGQQEVLRQFKTALDSYDTHWRLHHAYAEFLYKSLNNAPAAEEHLRVVVEHCPQSGLENSLLARVLSSQGKHDEAEEHYLRALLSGPQSTRILSEFGAFLLRQGKLEPAVGQLRKAIEIDPLNGLAHSDLGKALALRRDDPGSRQQAIWHLKKAAEVSPGNIQVRRNLAAYYSKEAYELLSRKEDDSARELLQEAVSSLPGSTTTSLRYNLAVLLDRGGDRETAVEHLSEILRIDPDHAKARELRRRLAATGE